MLLNISHLRKSPKKILKNQKNLNFAAEKWQSGQMRRS